MDARTKAVKSHRKRMRSSGMKRVEVMVRAEYVPLVREVAAELRAGSANAKRIESALRRDRPKEPVRNLAEALYDPAIAGGSFDEVFEELDRARRDPVMQMTRDIDL
jgi:hypothetical protein